MNKIARHYSHALFETAQEQDVFEEIRQDFSLLQNLYNGDPVLKNFVSNRYSRHSESMELLQTFKEKGAFAELTFDFLALLVQKRRLYLLEEIIEIFFMLCDKQQGIVRGEIITAEPLPAEIKKQFEDLLTRKTSKNITLLPKVDKNLLGGVIIHVGALKIDGSLQTRLRKIQDILHNG